MLCIIQLYFIQFLYIWHSLCVSVGNFVAHSKYLTVMMLLSPCCIHSNQKKFTAALMWCNFKKYVEMLNEFCGTLLQQYRFYRNKSLSLFPSPLPQVLCHRETRRPWLIQSWQLCFALFINLPPSFSVLIL